MNTNFATSMFVTVRISLSQAVKPANIHKNHNLKMNILNTVL